MSKPKRWLNDTGKVVLMDSRESIARRVRSLLKSYPERVSGHAALGLAIDLCDRRAIMYDGMAYMFAYARQQGYDLPPYALAGCGEIREFFSDQGVADMPSWYERIGISRDMYRNFYHYRLLVLIGSDYRRCALPIEIAWLDSLSVDQNRDDDAMELAKGVIDYVYDDVELPHATSFE